MKRTTLAVAFLTFGVLLWLSGRVVDTQPLFAAVLVLVALVFSASAARPTSN